MWSPKPKDGEVAETLDADEDVDRGTITTLSISTDASGLLKTAMLIFKSAPFVIVVEEIADTNAVWSVHSEAVAGTSMEISEIASKVTVNVTVRPVLSYPGLYRR